MWCVGLHLHEDMCVHSRANFPRLLTLVAYLGCCCSGCTPNLLSYSIKFGRFTFFKIAPEGDEDLSHGVFLYIVPSIGRPGAV